jgi:hypothetical protein
VAELSVGRAQAPELAAARRVGWSRWFFVGMGAWCIVLTVLGFAPSFIDYFAGKYHFPPIVHVHGAIMMSWLVFYTSQGLFAARGDVATHRRLGWIAMFLAAAVWLAMGVATVVALRRFDPAEAAFLILPLLIQIGTMVLFAIFVIWAVLARANSGWHKRLLSLATFCLVQAALDRIQWIPQIDVPMFWQNGLRLYVLLLVPLAIFDLLTLKRIHPATLTGATIIIAMHAVVSFLWTSEAWAAWANGFWAWLR